jgi:hypothetical protein
MKKLLKPSPTRADRGATVKCANPHFRHKRRIA